MSKPIVPRFALVVAPRVDAATHVVKWAILRVIARLQTWVRPCEVAVVDLAEAEASGAATAYKPIVQRPATSVEDQTTMLGTARHKL